MAASSSVIQVSCSLQRPPLSPKYAVRSEVSLASPLSLKNRFPIIHNLEQTVKEASLKLLDAFVDLTFEFVDQPLLPSQSNFAPVEDIGAAVEVIGAVSGTIPDDFTEGVYIRNDVNSKDFTLCLHYGGKFHIGDQHVYRAPGTQELVTFGIDAKEPYFKLGVISADGKKLHHKVDLKFQRCTLCHDIGVTQRYNVILDFPTIIDLNRLFMGGSIIKFEKDKFARIGVMPRYGDADSVRWFEVEPCSMFHIINCYEEGDEVIVMGCRAQDSIIPGPDLGLDKSDWFSRGFRLENSAEKKDDGKEERFGFLVGRPYEWRLNTKTGEVKQRYLVEPQFSMDFPFINDKFTGINNKYGYTQVVHSTASAASAIAKYGGLAKLSFEEKNLGPFEAEQKGEEYIKAEYHMFPENTFCTGSAFIAKLGVGAGAVEEDNGWLITFVHNEDTDISEVYIIDAKNFTSEPVAKITLPCRVPYGFHGAFLPAIQPV